MKQAVTGNGVRGGFQPPSGGCVLKRVLGNGGGVFDVPAAFRRLCVETTLRYCPFL